MPSIGEHGTKVYINHVFLAFYDSLEGPIFRKPLRQIFDEVMDEYRGIQA